MRRIKKSVNWFWPVAGLFLALAGCGKEEIMPNAAISFFPEGDRVVMSPGEKLELQVRLSPKEKIKELRIEKTALGVTAPFLTLTAFPDTGAVYVLTDQVDIAASDSSTIVYKFWATTTDNKTTVRTHTITVLGIDLHENVKIGAELDTLTGHYYSTKENKVYAPADTAKKYAAAVDFVYFNRAGAADSLAALGATIAAPGSAYAALAYPYDDSVNIAGLPSWSPRNATRFKPATAADFNLPGIYHITKAYNAAGEEQGHVSELSATTNSAFFFITADNRIGVARVREVITTPSAQAGHILLDVKVQR